MTRILLHLDIFRDIKLCSKKKWYKTLYKEMPRVCRLLAQDGMMSGERTTHYTRLPSLGNKIFHIRINLPDENVGKRQGARMIFLRENIDLIKIIYTGGHKDKRYDNSSLQVKLIQERLSVDRYIEYNKDLTFNNT